MSFVLSKILWFVFRPGNLLILVTLFFVIGAIWRTGSKWAWGALISLVLIITIGVLPIGHWLALPLEDRFARPATLPDHVDGIIVLGGPQLPDVAAEREVLATNEYAERLIESAALAERYPEAVLLYTGGSGSIVAGAPKERLVNDIFIELAGLDKRRIIHEETSRNTYENAYYSKELVDPKRGQIWVLVTSARHMPRSMGIFRQLDWDVIPWPVDYNTMKSYRWSGKIAFASHLDGLEDALREWIGLIAYWAMGRTDAIFPGPDT